MRAGYDSRGNFHDYIPHPERWEKKLKQQALLPEAPALGPRGKVDVRLPMGRDHVKGEKAAAIDARRKLREDKLRIAITAETTEKVRSQQLKARKMLKDSTDLSEEERNRLTALATAPLTDLVMEEAVQIEKLIAARMADGVVEVVN